MDGMRTQLGSAPLCSAHVLYAVYYAVHKVVYELYYAVHMVGYAVYYAVHKVGYAVYCAVKKVRYVVFHDVMFDRIRNSLERKQK